jgi:hypothetical protein
VVAGIARLGLIKKRGISDSLMKNKTILEIKAI